MSCHRLSAASAGIGRAIAAHLLANGWQVSGLDIATPSLEHADFTPVLVDLADGAAIESVAATPMPVDALVHAAWVPTTLALHWRCTGAALALR